MSWVNLDDVYVNKSGDSIAGNLSVGGALTINDGKGTDTTYNVANEITTLRDSVSPLHQYPGNVPGDVKSQTWYVMPIGGNKVVLCFEVVPWYISLTKREYYYKASLPIKIEKVLFSCSESTQWRCDRTRVAIEEDSPTEIIIAANIDRDAPNGTVADPYLIPVKAMIIATIQYSVSQNGDWTIFNFGTDYAMSTRKVHKTISATSPFGSLYFVSYSFIAPDIYDSILYADVNPITGNGLWIGHYVEIKNVIDVRCYLSSATSMSNVGMYVQETVIGKLKQNSVSQVSLYSGNITFSGSLNIGVISDNYKRIELSITIDNVVTTHFINNPTTGVDYAIPMIYIPSKTELRRIAFTRISFTSDGHTYLSKFTFVDNFGSISTLDNIKAKIDIVGYKQHSVSQLHKDDTLVLYGAPGKTSYVHIRCVGRMCILTWYVLQPTSAYWEISSVIPEKLRPENTFYTAACVTNDSGYILNVCAYCYVNTSGTVGFQVAASTSGAINRGTCSWFIK